MQDTNTLTPIAHDSFTLLATRRYARTVDAGKPQTARFYRALGTRLAIAAVVWDSQEMHDYAQFCTDRANDCRNRAEHLEYLASYHTVPHGPRGLIY